MLLTHVRNAALHARRDRRALSCPCPRSSTGSARRPNHACAHRRTAATVRILLGYGRQLAETAPQRSANPDFNAIAACFGTGRLHAILAHLQRGILRAMALERVLLARAARGRDIGFVAPRERAAATPAAPADAPPSEQSAANSPAAAQPAEAPVAQKPAARPSRPAGWNDPELYMPTLEELEAQARRRPPGRSLVDICLDLAVVPGFCAGPFWNELFDSIRLHGGSIGTLMQEKARREKAFGKEQDSSPGATGTGWRWDGRRSAACWGASSARRRMSARSGHGTICAGRGGGHRPALTGRHLEEKLAHGTGSWPAPAFRFVPLSGPLRTHKGKQSGAAGRPHAPWRCRAPASGQTHGSSSAHAHVR